MDIIKKYISYIGIAVTLILGVLLYMQYKSNQKLRSEWENAVENCKTYSTMFSDYNNENRGLKLTVDQLISYNDSIVQQLDETRKGLRIKDSQLKSLQYVKSVFTKADTIILSDTLFRDPQVNIDTIISDDEWYRVEVGLKYPSTVAVIPEFKSVKHIIVSSKKETVNPPKKFFLFRWFQKKHYVLNIDVIEKNPYIKDGTNRYIEIVR